MHGAACTSTPTGDTCVDTYTHGAAPRSTCSSPASAWSRRRPGARARWRRRRYDLALNLGVCGSFDPALAPGTVVHVVSDRIAELGAEDGDAFLTIEEMELAGESEFVQRDSADEPRRSTSCPRSRHHREHRPRQRATIAAVVERFKPQVESMEGAAFMSACLMHKVPFAQVRAVSNIVERRNRDAWKMAEAIANLGARPLRHPRARMTLVARLLAVPERLFHVRRDRQPADRSRGAGVRRAPRRRRGAEQGGVRRRRRRHQAELSRLRLLHRRLRAARRRQRARPQLRAAADFEARDRAGRGRGRRPAGSRFPGSYTTANFLLGLAFPNAQRQDAAGVLGDRAGAARRTSSTPGSSSTRTASPTRRRG